MPQMTSGALDLSDLTAEAVVTITHPDGRMTKHLASDGPVPLTAVGFYSTGIQPPPIPDPDAGDEDETPELLVQPPYEGPTFTIAPSQAQTLEAWRSTASMTVTDFTEAALDAGHITEADADASIMRNAIPTIVQTAVATLPAAQRKKAVRAIMGATTVRRASPFVALLQRTLGLTDAQVDALFGDVPT